MEILQLDIGGKLAHFRKYYANNTAMSFSIPPRTTIIGMLAGILGRPRDSYYEEFASEHIKIGIRVMQPLKKSFHRVNFLRVVSKGDFDGSGGRIQTPFEVVSGLDISRDQLTYRLFISCSEIGRQTFDLLKNAVLARRQQYALTFGTANFTASVLSVHLFKGDAIRTAETAGLTTVHSAIPSEAIEALDFDRRQSVDTLQAIEEELLPADFVSNFDRELRRMNRVLFSTTASGIRVELNRSFFVLQNGQELQHILFLE